MTIPKISTVTFFSVMTAILVTGILLDEAGKGTFGTTVKNVAVKVTSGYGV